jgi:hypothetical protein
MSFALTILAMMCRCGAAVARSDDNRRGAMRVENSDRT